MDVCVPVCIYIDIYIHKHRHTKLTHTQTCSTCVSQITIVKISKMHIPCHCGNQESFSMRVICSMNRLFQSLLCGDSHVLFASLDLWVSCRRLRGLLLVVMRCAHYFLLLLFCDHYQPQRAWVSLNLLKCGPQNLTLTGKLNHLSEHFK